MKKKTKQQVANNNRWNNFTLIKIKADAKKATVNGRIHGKEFNLEQSGETTKEAFEKVMDILARTVHLM